MPSQYPLKVMSAAVVGIGSLLPLTAAAADLPTLDPIIEARPVSSWTGFYAGAFLGWGWSDDDATTTGTSGFQSLGSTIVPSSLDLSGNGFLGGLTAGYDHQINSFVAGLEGDISWADINKSSSFTGAAVLGTRLTTSAKKRMSFFSTVRGRLGYAASDRFMVFATGGLAMGQVELETSVNGVDAPALAWNGSDDELKFGWTLGGGAEVKVTDNISMKLDGLYYDLADSNVTATGNAAVRSVGALDGIDYAAESDNTGFLARLGVNYRF
ncbi:outer membrane protein [Roseibium sp.]|uniref:outer membrane protein n=1 Tax=Roseibium sp. TaxID=1936156 RepID=UPI003D1246DE